MTEIQFFVLTFFALMVLVKLDAVRTDRRRANWRNWRVYIAARAYRKTCDDAWGVAWDRLCDEWTPENRIVERQAASTRNAAGRWVEEAYEKCKGKCPADLLAALKETQ